mmetsp:Transcript_21126/g.39027  ORF Transcript_21126/g.39027 Transcript_21126/m.39027 type:complete len:1097 (+) Transcript_21126:55-3345(+)
MKSSGSETVRVIARVRPLNESEIVRGCQNTVDVDRNLNQISILKDQVPKTFAFDSVYGIESLQRTIYDESAFPIVESVLEGYNGTVFAYGQTGCGKTFTMTGVPDSLELRGIIPNSFAHIFEEIIEHSNTKTYLVRCSFLEIYNEQLKDLLDHKTEKKLSLKENKDHGVYVAGLSSHPVTNINVIEKFMEEGTKHRTTRETMMNERSSRSHSLFIVQIEQSEETEGRTVIKAGKLNLVDLAGSERQKKTGTTGDSFKEAVQINLSLNALGNVISALVDGTATHVPYRDSKLTRLLQDSLGGNTRTLMIAVVSPADYNYEESLSTLRYASRAKHIQNKPVVNEDPKDALLRSYAEEITRLKMLLSQREGGEPVVIEKIVERVVEKTVDRYIEVPAQGSKLDSAKEDKKRRKKQEGEERPFEPAANFEDRKKKPQAEDLDTSGLSERNRGELDRSVQQAKSSLNKTGIVEKTKFKKQTEAKQALELSDDSDELENAPVKKKVSKSKPRPTDVQELSDDSDEGIPSQAARPPKKRPKAVDVPELPDDSGEDEAPSKAVKKQPRAVKVQELSDDSEEFPETPAMKKAKKAKAEQPMQGLSDDSDDHGSPMAVSKSVRQSDARIVRKAQVDKVTGQDLSAAYPPPKKESDLATLGRKSRKLKSSLVDNPGPKPKHIQSSNVGVKQLEAEEGPRIQSSGVDGIGSPVLVASPDLIIKKSEEAIGPKRKQSRGGKRSASKPNQRLRDAIVTQSSAEVRATSLARPEKTSNDSQTSSEEDSDEEAPVDEKERIETFVTEIQRQLITGDQKIEQADRERLKAQKEFQHQITKRRQTVIEAAQKQEEELMMGSKQYTSLQDEVDDQRKLILKLRLKYKASMAEVNDLTKEHGVEREFLLETIRKLEHEIDFFQKVCDYMLAPGELTAIRGKATFKEDENVWSIPPFLLQHKQTLFPKLPKAQGKEVVQNELRSRQIVFADRGTRKEEVKYDEDLRSARFDEWKVGYEKGFNDEESNLRFSAYYSTEPDNRPTTSNARRSKQMKAATKQLLLNPIDPKEIIRRVERNPVAEPKRKLDPLPTTYKNEVNLRTFPVESVRGRVRASEIS